MHSIEIVALGGAPLAGSTFTIDREGACSAGESCTIGVERVSGSTTVVPTSAWLEDAAGERCGEPALGDGHDEHWHFSLRAPATTTPSRLVLRAADSDPTVSGSETIATAALSLHDSVAPRRGGIVTPLWTDDGAGRAVAAFAELSLDSEKGDLELWLMTETTTPLDLPHAMTQVEVLFPSHGGRAVALREHWDGAPGGRTDAFAFVGRADAAWLRGAAWRGLTTVTVTTREASDDATRKWVSDPFVVVPASALIADHGHSHEHEHEPDYGRVGFVVKNTYDVRGGPIAIVEPLRLTLLVAIDPADGETAAATRRDEHARENSFALARDIDELEHKIQGLGERPDAVAALRAAKRRWSGARAREGLGERGRGSFEWRIDGVRVGVGRSVNVTLSDLGDHELELVAIGGDDADGQEEVVGSGVLRVHHVRRDVNALTPADRAALFAAARQLYAVEGDAGRATFGAAYRSMKEVWVAHALLGGDGDDHELLCAAAHAAEAADGTPPPPSSQGASSASSAVLAAEPRPPPLPDADARIAASKAHRHPSYKKKTQGHRIEVEADSNDWDAVGAEFRGQIAAARERAALLGAPPQDVPIEGGASAAATAAGGVALATTSSSAAELEAAAASHDALQSAGHGSLGVATNYASFVLLFEVCAPWKGAQLVGFSREESESVPTHGGG